MYGIMPPPAATYDGTIVALYLKGSMEGN